MNSKSPRVPHPEDEALESSTALGIDAQYFRGRCPSSTRHSQSLAPYQLLGDFQHIGDLRGSLKGVLAYVAKSEMDA